MFKWKVNLSQLHDQYVQVESYMMISITLRKKKKKMIPWYVLLKMLPKTKKKKNMAQTTTLF